MEEKIDYKNKKSFIDIKITLNKLKEAGKETPKNRQVGAWKSNKITPYSLVSNIEKVSIAGIKKPSKQHWERLNEVMKIVKKYQKEVDIFVATKWKIFLKKINN